MHPTDWLSPFFLPVQTWRIPTPTLLDLLIHWSYPLFTVSHHLSPPFPVLLHVKKFKHFLHCIYIAVSFSFGKHYILIKSNILPPPPHHELNMAGMKAQPQRWSRFTFMVTPLLLPDNTILSLSTCSLYSEIAIIQLLFFIQTHNIFFISLLLSSDLI